MDTQKHKNIGLLKNLEQLVANEFCIGCGLCVSLCPEESAEMVWNRYGAYEPKFENPNCTNCQICTQVCPFSDGVIEGITNPDEDEIGKKLFGPSNAQPHPMIGFHHNCYAGYAEDFRSGSTSGGLTSWILARLLETRRVDKVICVSPGETQNALFRYSIISTPEEIRSAAKSRYYPIHLADVLHTVLAEEGKYGIVALPCIVKGIRYAQMQNEVLRRRIIFCVGLFCGGYKTTHFTEYLAAQLGVGKEEISKPEYRIKHEGPTSQGYSFGCQNPEKQEEMLEFRVKRLRDLWGPGFFKPNVCDYCDDVVSEVADISVGDAWIKPYTSDWRGTNIIITRSTLAQLLIEEGLENDSLTLDKISSESVVKSQKSNFEHRRTGLAYRLFWAGNQAVPRKRVQARSPRNWIQGKIYRQRMQVRARSQEAWLLQRDKPGTRIFDQAMKKDLEKLNQWHTFDRFYRKLFKPKS